MKLRFERRTTHRHRQLSSRWLASILAIGYLVVSALLGALMLAVPRHSPQAQVNSDMARVEEALRRTQAEPPVGSATGKVITPTTPSAPSTAKPPAPRTPDDAPSSAPAPDIRYVRVTGPGAMRTVIPAGWTTRPSTGPGAIQATDPRDAGRYLRFGSAPAPRGTVYESHRDYERTFASGKTDFTRLRLESTTFHGEPAVTWEFEHASAEGRRHVSSLYWRKFGREYFVYASSGPARWTETKVIFDMMIANAKP